jgi:beta-fructofuranosidase
VANTIRSNFFSLEDEDGDIHYYVMMGTEGGNLTWHPRAQWGLWNEGYVTRRANGSAQFTPVAGGSIDSGLLYAVTSFNDTKNNRRVQWVSNAMIKLLFGTLTNCNLVL